MSRRESLTTPPTCTDFVLESDFPANWPIGRNFRTCKLFAHQKECNKPIAHWPMVSLANCSFPHGKSLAHKTKVHRGGYGAFRDVSTTILSSLSVQFAIFCCSIGYTDGHIPVMAANDTIEVFLMKAPVFEFRFGDLLGKLVS